LARTALLAFTLCGLAKNSARCFGARCAATCHGFLFRNLAVVALKERSELFFHHLAGDFFAITRGKAAQLERTIGHAHQTGDRPAKMFHHAADFTVLAFAQGHRHPGVGIFLNINLGMDRSVVHTINGDTFFKLFKL
tara:strand:- start:34 stop:444 length:411 start_codon:yes stop_codon:yes gene_type:complete